ncbi:hypothetical protein [Marivita sp. S2033]|uniref:hypothetical protein n=1 Tax=Marivita sp. S2033 TaxID=3373187 RepID=UPI0039827862
MKRKFTKQNRNDFLSRIERLDPAFAATPAKARSESKPWEVDKTGLCKSQSPILMSILGFVLATGAAYALREPEAIEALLAGAGWPAQFLSYATYTVLFTVLGVVLYFVKNLFRIVNPRAPGRWNAGGLVFGAVAAIGLSSVPDTVYQAGFEFAGFESADDMFDFAHSHTSKLASIDWASVVMVSSTAK